MDRKEIVKTLSEFLGVKPKYLGAPSFAYEIKTESESYIIDRQGVITNSNGSTVDLNEILNPGLNAQKPKIKSIDCFEVEIPFGNHTGKSMLNIINMISSKQNLIVKVFDGMEPFVDRTFAQDINNKAIDSIESFKNVIAEIGVERCKGLYFDFNKRKITFKLILESLSPKITDAFMKLVSQINENAKRFKYTSFKEAQEDNPKYAFRVWLMRLGMMGSEYKSVRKTLLSKLEGSGAFRNISDARSTEING